MTKLQVSFLAVVCGEEGGLRNEVLICGGWWIGWGESAVERCQERQEHVSEQFLFFFLFRMTTVSDERATSSWQARSELIEECMRTPPPTLSSISGGKNNLNIAGGIEITDGRLLRLLLLAFVIVKVFRDLVTVKEFLHLRDFPLGIESHHVDPLVMPFLV